MITPIYEHEASIILEALINYTYEIPGGHTNPDFKTIISILDRLLNKKEMP